MSPYKFSKLSKKILFSLISFQSHEVYQKVFFDYLGMTKGDLRRFFEKKMYLKISQISKKNCCIGVSSWGDPSTLLKRDRLNGIFRNF